MTVSQQIRLSRSEKRDFRALLLRSLDVAKRNGRLVDVVKLEREIAQLDLELGTE